MPFSDARAGWIVAMVALALAALDGMVAFSARAGSLETRVSSVEARQASIDAKIDKIADALSRIEGKLEK